MFNEAFFESKLDYLCDRLELRPVGFVDTKYGPVYIAEGYVLCRKDHDVAGSGWTVLWAVKQRGTCVAQAMYLPSNATPETRKGAAIQTALEYLGTYHGQPLARRFLERAH